MASLKDFVKSPLTDAKLDIQFALPLVTTELTQHFFNDTDTVIEACYQFPVPREAVLGNVNVSINGEAYKGKVLEKAVAEERYEEGVAEGKRTVLIKDIGDGLYELNLGNLAPDEKAAIAITIHQLCHVEGDQVRYFLPTVIAPRYGSRMFIESPEPVANALVNYAFSATLSLPQESTLISSSHSMERIENNQVQFSGYLNQDIKFAFRTNNSGSYFYCAPFGDGYATIGAFVPSAKETEVQGESGNRSVQLLVDCSGSMDGVSIEHVSEGLQEIFSEFPSDRKVNLIEYGSNTYSLYDQPQKITPEFSDALDTLSADLGGTEIEKALSLAINQLKQTGTDGDIILLTDGQVWGDHRINELAEEAANTGIRIFCVGVGYAISESVLEQLSGSTGATLTLVNPHENMATALFKVFTQSAHQNLWAKVALPDETISQENLWHPSFFFRHQTSPVAIISEQKPEVVTVQGSNIPVLPADPDAQLAVTQLVAKLLINQMDLSHETYATRLATQANIISQYTSYSMVSEQSVEQADGMPALANVPQMEKRAYANVSSNTAASPGITASSSAPVEASCNESGYLDVPAFLRRTCDDDIPEPEENLVNALKARIRQKRSRTFRKREALLTIERRLDRRSSETRPVAETLNYRYLEECGLDIEKAKSYGLKDEIANCAQFLLMLAEQLSYEFNQRVEKLLRAKTQSECSGRHTSGS